MPSQPIMKITRVQSGTYTLHLHRPDRKPERWRTGIPSYEDAVKRARIVQAMCGYRVDLKEYES